MLYISSFENVTGKKASVSQSLSMSWCFLEVNHCFEVTLEIVVKTWRATLFPLIDVTAMTMYHLNV